MRRRKKKEKLLLEAAVVDLISKCFELLP